MKKIFKIAGFFFLISVLFAPTIPAVQAQVMNQYWKLTSNVLQPVNDAYGLKVVKFGGTGAKCLHTDNAGTISTSSADCGSGGGSPAGVLGSIQFNDGAGGFGASGNLLWNPTGNIFTTAYASTTAVSASSLCLLTDCRSSWPLASGWTRSGGKIFPTTQTDMLTATSSTITGPCAVNCFYVKNTDPDGSAGAFMSDATPSALHTVSFGYNLLNGGLQTSWIDNTGNVNLSIFGTGSTTIGARPGTQYNKFNVAGGAAIGRTYAGLNNNDPDGLIVEGKGCFGCSDLADTADYFTVNGASGLVGAVHTYSTLQVDSTSNFSGALTAGNVVINGSLTAAGSVGLSNNFLSSTGGGVAWATNPVTTSFTGWIPYYKADGSILSATSTIFINNNSTFNMGVTNIGYVGIATTSPGSMLSIGATDAGWNITPGTSTINTAGGLNVVKGCFAYRGSCVSGSVSTGTTGQVPYYAANGDNVKATSTISIDSMSEVGIGTTTPGWALDVAGTRPSIAITDSSAGANNKHWVMSSMGGNFYLGTSTDSFGTSTPAAFSIQSSKWPGLSVSSSTPNGQLTVNTSNNQYPNIAFIASSTATQMRIDDSGNVYFPSTASSGSTQTGYWCYDSNGQLIRDTVTCLVSAAKFKKDIQPINAGLNEVLAMRPVNYFLKTPLGINDTAQQFGFIAEEAEKVDPRLVTYDNNGDIHSFRYEQYTAVLTKAIQELNESRTGDGSKETVQWLLIGVLFGAVIYQQIRLNKLSK